MILEILSAVLGVAVLVLVYVAFGAKAAVSRAVENEKAHKGDAAVQRARAERFRKVIDQLGADVEEAERREEAAHGGSAAAAAARLNLRVRRLLQDKGGQGGGTGGEGGPLPGA